MMIMNIIALQLVKNNFLTHLSVANKYMFEHLGHHQDHEHKFKNKTIFIIQNGHPERVCELQTTKKLTKDDIVKEVQKKWGFGKYKNMRLFTIDAVEYYLEDLQYVKDGQRLYISKGEEFDSNSNFGEYQIIKELGKGGFGHVSLVRNIITNEMAAIKVVKADRLSNSSDVDMIFRQAENLKTLNHPNIVKILNCYTLRDMKVVIVMQYLQGGQLKQLQRKKQKFTELQAKKYLKQVICAVSYCHRKGLIHRDLKLQNILLTKQNVVKVADFGISGVNDRFNPEVDWGTLRYMSPQVLSKKQKVNSPAVDVWALGVILYYMVFGQYPFNGISSLQIRQSIINEELQFPKNMPISEKCKNLITQMLAKETKNRINMIDVEDHPWIVSFEDFLIKPQDILREESSTSITFPKNQRKSSNFNKNLGNVVIPKRLQKQRNQLAEELQVYKLNRKMFRSETKKFPGLKRRCSLNKKALQNQCSVLSNPVNRFNLAGADSVQIRRKKDLLASWK